MTKLLGTPRARLVGAAGRSRARTLCSLSSLRRQGVRTPSRARVTVPFRASGEGEAQAALLTATRGAPEPERAAQGAPELSAPPSREQGAPGAPGPAFPGLPGPAPASPRPPASSDPDAPGIHAGLQRAPRAEPRSQAPCRAPGAYRPLPPSAVACVARKQAPSEETACTASMGTRQCGQVVAGDRAQVPTADQRPSPRGAGERPRE